MYKGQLAEKNQFISPLKIPSFGLIKKKNKKEVIALGKNSVLGNKQKK